jgi:hypothetical protein
VLQRNLGLLHELIVDSKKVLTHPIIALPLSAFTLPMLPHFFTHIREKIPRLMIITNGNGFCQELLSDHELCKWAII